MTIGGWIFIVLSWGIILALCAYTFAGVLGLRIKNILAPLDIETDEKTRTKKGRKTPRRR